MRDSRLRCIVATLACWLSASAAPVFAQDAARAPIAAPGASAETQQSRGFARLWQEGDPGQRLHLRGRVTSAAGDPVEGAEIVVWQTDGAGSYHPDRYRARLFSTGEGEFRLTTAVPGQYYGLGHIHVVISHPNYQSLMTRVLFKGDPHLGSADEDLAILLEEVRNEDKVVMVGSVQFVLAPM